MPTKPRPRSPKSLSASTALLRVAVELEAQGEALARLESALEAVAERLRLLEGLLDDIYRAARGRKPQPKPKGD